MKLLTPGPLTTTQTVKEQMNIDRCTWEEDYKSITQNIRQSLLKLAEVDEQEYTTILMQGSGSFIVEAVLHTAISSDDKLLIISNGAYGERIIKMTKRLGHNHVVYNVPYDEAPSEETIEQYIQSNPDITHIVMVHCETTTGILNPVQNVGEIARKHNLVFILDAMSSFGGVPMNIEELGIDYLISSANKCIQGVPGFGFVIAKQSHFMTTKGNSKSLSLDLYDQWKTMNVDGKWRYTSPTHVVAAFSQAIEELIQEGGVVARYERYKNNNLYLREKMTRLGFHPYITLDKQSPIITTYLFPDADFDFGDFYNQIKEKGFTLYPGKLMDADSFRIGNIGDLHEEDFKELVQHINHYMEERAYA